MIYRVIMFVILGLCEEEIVFFFFWMFEIEIGR